MKKTHDQLRRDTSREPRRITPSQLAHVTGGTTGDGSIHQTRDSISIRTWGG